MFKAQMEKIKEEKMKKLIVIPVSVILLVLTVVAGSVAMRIIYHLLPIEVDWKNKWSIGIYEGSSPFHFHAPSDIKNPVISASDVTDVKAFAVADPFLVRNNGCWYMFFEVMNTCTDQGDIALATSEDGKKWKYEKVVLDEEYHLSYPYVFNHEGNYYMIPESGKANKLNLYRAVNFPFEWERVSTLLEGSFGDHGIVQHQGCWYLFANPNPYQNNKLNLYYSDDLFGKFIELPMSPVVSDNASMARPGGRMISWDGGIIRYTQNCKKEYGKALNAVKITELTKEKYAEEKIKSNPILKSGKNEWNRHGMHHLEAVQIDDQKWIGFVDGYTRRCIINYDY